MAAYGPARNRVKYRTRKQASGSGGLPGESMFTIVNARFKSVKPLARYLHIYVHYGHISIVVLALKRNPRHTFPANAAPCLRAWPDGTDYLWA